MATERSGIEEVWRRALDANLRYYEALGKLSAEYLKAYAGALGQLRVSRAAAPATSVASPQTSQPVENRPAPVMALEAQEGGAAVGVFMVENHLGDRVTGPVSLSPLADAEGREVVATVKFEPDVVTLEPGEQMLVQTTATVDRTFKVGVDYRGAIRVPGLRGTEIPIVVRRLRARKPARPRAKS